MTGKSHYLRCAHTHAHATTASSVKADSTNHVSWNGKATENTWYSHLAKLSGLLRGFSVEGVGAPVGDAGDGCVVGISVNVFPCTFIESDTETVTRIGVRPA